MGGILMAKTTKKSFKSKSRKGRLTKKQEMQFYSLLAGGKSAQEE